MARSAGSHAARDGAARLGLGLSAGQCRTYPWRGASRRIYCATGSPSPWGVAFGAVDAALGSPNTHCRRRSYPGGDFWSAPVHHPRQRIYRLEPLYLQNGSRGLRDGKRSGVACATANASFGNNVDKGKAAGAPPAARRRHIARYVAYRPDVGTSDRLLLKQSVFVDTAEVIGYLLGAFGLGYCAGFLIYVFRRLTDYV